MTSKYKTFTSLLCAGAPLFLAGHIFAQNLFVADSQSGNIYEVSPSGTQTTFASGFNYPDAVAFDTGGDLYEENGRAGTIDKFIYNSGVLSPTPTPFASGFNDPEGIAINSAGDVLVSNHGGGVGTTISEITPGGSVSTFATGLSGPYALAFDSKGDLFESDNEDGKINEFKNVNGVLSSTPTMFASGLDDVYGLAFNGAGILFGLSRATGGIYEFTPSGGQSMFINSGPTGANNIAFDTSGNLYEADGTADDNAIVKFSPTGQESIFDPGLNNPVGLAFQGIALPVPEPSTWAMLALGASGLLLRRKKS